MVYVNEGVTVSCLLIAWKKTPPPHPNLALSKLVLKLCCWKTVCFLGQTMSMNISHSYCHTKWRVLLMQYIQYAPSKTGLASKICCSIHECCPLTAARNWRMSLVDSVLPAPLSPLQHNQLKALTYRGNFKSNSSFRLHSG